MPIRIYALAKKLGIENKDLVDICSKAGIKGKGSALASLDDDEVSKVKAFIDSNSASARSAPKATPDAPERPDRAAQPVAPSKPPIIASKSAKSSAGKPSGSGQSGDSGRSSDTGETPASDAPVSPAEPIESGAETPPAEVAATSDGGALDAAAGSKDSSGDGGGSSATDAPSSGGHRPGSPRRGESPLGGRVAGNTDSGSAAPMKRGDGLIPNRSAGGIRVLDRPKNKPKKDRENAGKRDTGKREGPAKIRMAAMPEVKQPPKPRVQEQKVQKPDIALPQDTIRKVRKEGAGPLHQFTENTKSKSKKKGKGTGQGAQENVTQEIVADDGRGRGARGPKKTGAPGEGDGRLDNTREARTRNRKRSGGARRRDGDDSPSPLSYRRRHQRRRSGVNTAAPRKEAVTLELPCTVRTFSEAAGVPAGQVLKALMEMGTMVNINAQLDDEMAHILAEELGVQIGFREQESLEDSLINQIEDLEDTADDLAERPPVVTFLGHVDHGKTSLLDAIIGLKVASGEAGGITQHIRAYTVDKDGRQISFVDTPGHEAFTEMRARGANVTDIAVLVVAADDGVMPQTEEAISHAKAAGVPIVVALNKIDVPGADPNKAMQDLASHDLLPSEWGGEIEVVKTSAITGEGLDSLLETLLVTAELHEYKANPDRAATGVCLEAEQEPGRGVIAKMIVKNGTLRVGDVVVCGSSYGRVKAMYNTLDVRDRLEEAGPSVPVNLTGLDTAPDAGDKFYVLEDIADAREIAESRHTATRTQELAPITKRISLDVFQQRLEAGNLAGDIEVSTLNLIIRADTQGSIEAIKKELGKLAHPEVEVRILQASVGGITVADVTLAGASDAVVLGFNVVPDEAAKTAADEKSVEVRRYDVIYKLTEDIKATLEGKLKPEEHTVELGTAMVLRTFNISRTGTVAGCRVMRGVIDRNCRVRVIRDSRVIGDYGIDTLKREKDDAKEVRQGMECGIKLAGFNDIKEADSFEAYRIEEVARTL